MPVIALTLLSATMFPDQSMWAPKEHLGKTSAQVVAMGWEKWETLRIEKREELTNGEIIDEYTMALDIENTKFARSKSRARQAWIKKADLLAHQLATDWTNMGQPLYDGTRWRTEGYWVHYQAELAVRRWLSQKPPKAGKIEPKWLAFRDLDRDIKDYEPMDGANNSKPEIIKARNGLEATHRAFVKHIATGTKTDSVVYDMLFRSVILL